MRIRGLTAIGIIGGLFLGYCLVQGSRHTVVPTDSIPLFAGAQKIIIPPEMDVAHSDSGTAPPGDNPSEPECEQAIASSPESRLQYKLALLERGRDALRLIKCYTAQLRKQEVVRGELLDEQVMSIKCRHHPFSVYLVWQIGDVGREAIYVEGQNNGNLIAHDGGWKSRLPAFSMPTDGSLAMMDARCPITTAGLMCLTEAMMATHLNDLKCSTFVSCEIDPHRRFDGRPCLMFTTKYKSAEASPIYRKSITLIDHEWNLPVQTRHFEWCTMGKTMSETELDRATIIESYSFTDIQLGCHLTDHDFERTNQEYHFH